MLTWESPGRAQFDRSYVDRLAAGDAETERHFERYFRDRLAAKLRLRLRSPSLAEDARQETFLRVFAALRNGCLATPESLGAFVNSVCNNVVFETYRLQSRLPASSPEEGEDVVEDRPDAESALLCEEARMRVRQVLSELPAKDQELLSWLFLEERDRDDVCRRLGITRAYLRVLVHRAMARFRSEFLDRAQGRGVESRRPDQTGAAWLSISANRSASAAPR